MTKKSLSHLARDFMAALGFMESTRDITRKPALIDKIVENAITVADLQTQYPQDVPYRTRLKAALNSAKASDLDVLIENNVTVCLDRRLSSDDGSRNPSDVWAVFFGSGDRNILSLYDNGKDPTHGRWSGNHIADRSRDAIENLAILLRQGKKPTTVAAGIIELQVAMAGEGGGVLFHGFAWKKEEELLEKVRGIPSLQSPPLQLAAPKPTSSTPAPKI